MRSFKFIFWLFAICVLAACGAQSVDATSAQTETEAPSDMTLAASWEMDSAASFLKFSALQEGQIFEGEFKDFSTKIHFDASDLEASYVKVVVSLNTVDAGSIDRNSTLLDKLWFSVKAFPEAIYEAREFEALGEGQYVAKGQLSMKGQNRDFNLPFNLEIENGTALMTAQTAFNRTEWNVGEEPWNTDEWVSTEVKLDIKVSAKQGS